MNKAEIRKHPDNPYRLFENPSLTLESFLLSRGLPAYWGTKELKLAWAFRGLLGEDFELLDENRKYANFFYEPFLTCPGVTLKESLTAADNNPSEFYYQSNVSGHWAIARLSGPNCTLSKNQKNEILRAGTKINRVESNTSQVILGLDEALKNAGNSDSSNFRIISRQDGKMDALSALCAAFEIPDLETEYYPSDTFKNISVGKVDLLDPAKIWLETWVEDENLKTHLRCFVEKPQFFGDKADMFLASHCNHDWSDRTRYGSDFPIGLDALNALPKLSCLLSWEWCHGDLTESKALVALSN